MYVVQLGEPQEQWLAQEVAKRHPSPPHPVSDFFPSESISGAGVCRMSLCLGLPDIFLRLRGGLEEEQPRS